MIALIVKVRFREKNIRAFLKTFISISLIIFTLSDSLYSQTSSEDFLLCDYPRRPARIPSLPFDRTSFSVNDEVEPNDTRQTAQIVPIGFSNDQRQNMDISGKINSFEEDWFSFSAAKYDTIGIAVLSTDGIHFDPVLDIWSPSGNLLLQNDNHNNLASLYPPESPFPAGGSGNDSCLTYSFSNNGKYYIRVKGRGASAGEYRLQMRIRKPSMKDTRLGTKQIIFLDFNGAKINAKKLFGVNGNPNAELSSFESYLHNWGISQNRKGALISKIVANVSDQFKTLLISTQSDVEIQNSQSHRDSFGQPNVSRVIVGGSTGQLGIPTIGISQYIDPGNYSMDDTAVVLLDNLSKPRGNKLSILSIKRDHNYLLEDAVANIVASLISHEIAHFLGCWHTNNRNNVNSLTDEGGYIKGIAGVGPDETLGTQDDIKPFFLDDNYNHENIGRKVDIQNTQTKLLVSLATGTLSEEAEISLIRSYIENIDTIQSQLSSNPNQPLQNTPPFSFPNHQIMQLQLLTSNIELPSVRIELIKEILNDRLEKGKRD